MGRIHYWIDAANEGEVELYRKPIGVVGSITPWNFPVMIAIWHIMPALRTGNTVVIKPSPLTPLATLRLVEIMNEVLPAGVVNVVTSDDTGDNIGAAMSAHPDIRKIVFTGSCAEPAEMSIELFSKSVGLANPVNLNRLIKNGHTPATQMRNLKTHALQNYITKANTIAFHDKFTTLRILAKARGDSWQKMSGALKAANVVPFSPDGKDYGNLYLKSEVETALG